MSVTVVVGAQWGDEGKAKVIDLLARETSVVARYQGGHNAGHTVVVGTEKYALQLIPSGVLYDHVTPVIGNGVVVDMPTLFAEIDRLESRGISCAKLKVSSQAHLIFLGTNLLMPSLRATLAITRLVRPSKVLDRLTPTRLAGSAFASALASISFRLLNRFVSGR